MVALLLSGEDPIQHSAGASLKLCQGNLLTNSTYNPIHIPLGAGHRQIVARPDAHCRVGAAILEGLVGRIGGAPVGHNQALEAPLTSEHIGDKFFTVGSMNTVNQIIAGQQGSRIGVLNRNLETLQIDLPQCPLGAMGIGMGTVVLLIV